MIFYFDASILIPNATSQTNDVATVFQLHRSTENLTPINDMIFFYIGHVLAQSKLSVKFLFLFSIFFEEFSTCDRNQNPMCAP